jgi:hypothetical protein
MNIINEFEISFLNKAPTYLYNSDHSANTEDSSNFADFVKYLQTDPKTISIELKKWANWTKIYLTTNLTQLDFSDFSFNSGEYLSIDSETPFIDTINIPCDYLIICNLFKITKKNNHISLTFMDSPIFIKDFFGKADIWYYN